MVAEIQRISEAGLTDRKRDKRMKFVKLAEKRTINAIRAIRRLGKLGNKAHYEYDENDVKKIVSALNKEVEALKTKMTRSSTQESIDFRL